MKLRTKLLVGYAGFVLALGVLGAWSARTLSQMSAVSGRIIAENYDSVVAAQDMKESLERQDSAAVFDLLGQHDRARAQMAEHRPRFDAALAKAASNITETGEAEIVSDIRSGRDEYYRRFDAFLSRGRPRAADPPAGEADGGTALYFRSLEPQFNTVRRACDALLRVNQEAMRRKADEASQIARRWFFVTLALAVGLMLAGVGVEVSLSNAILGPVRQLTAATTRVAGGDLDTAVPVRSADEIGTLAVGFNRMAERIRGMRQDDLNNVSRLKSEFIGTASRELRTPLTSVQMSIHLLLEGAAGALTDRQQEILQACREDTARLDRLMRELMELSAIESGTAASVRVAIRPSTLVAAAVEPLRLQVDERGVRLDVDVPPDLPMVAVDRGQFERVIANLVTNATRATPAGGAITVAAGSRDDGVAISVTDTGSGISRDDLARIFEPFVREPHPSTGGAGLGLPISRRIVEAHGGRLTAESSEGHGSTFTLTVPVARHPDGG
jgi:signal transduction histidine kinase